MPATYLPNRKPHRLPAHDYSTPGVYFITFCTQNRRNILWDTPKICQLSPVGEIVRTAIEDIPRRYPAVTVEKYVVMPNHVHLLLQIREQHAPAVSRIVQQLKGYASKRAGQPLWQKLFHDHVVRSEDDFLQIWTYIENNPLGWKEDCFYSEI